MSTRSLRDLRAQLLQDAAALAARARRHRARGDLRSARTYEERAARLVEIARSVDVS
jgi:hypothetical protein